MTSLYSADTKVEVAFNAGVRTPEASRTWTDVSTYVELEAGISITGGRADERATCEANSCSLVLDNSDGRFTPDRTSSPYYPNVKIGRPIRVTSTYPPAPAANLLSAANADLEGGVGSWTAGGSVPPTLSSTSVRAWSGTKSLLVTWGTGGTFPLAQVNLAGLTIGVVYTWSAYVWVPTGSPHVQLAVGGGIGLVGSATTVRDQWVRLSGSFTAAATSHGMQVWPSTAPTAGNTVYVDAAMPVVGTELGDFNTVTAATSTRFEGYVDEWPIDWAEGVDTYSAARLTASSRMARMGAAAELRSLVESTILGLGPVAYYTMGDDSASTSAADSSGLGADPLVRWGSGANPVFGNATGVGTDGLTAAEFTAGGKALRDAATGSLPTGATICFFYNSAGGHASTVVQALGISFNNNGCVGDSTNRTGGAAVGATSIDDGVTHHVALRWSGSNLYVYIDGANLASATTSGDLVIQTTLANAGLTSGSGTFTLCHLALFDYDIGGAGITAISEAGLTGGDQEPAVDRLDRLAVVAGVETAASDFDAAATLPIAFFDPSGAGPLDAMRRVETTEGGVLFDSRDNTLTYAGRAARYGATSALSLSMLTHEVEDSVTPRYDRGTVLNDVTATTTNGGSFRAVDQTSIDDYDPASGSVELMSTDMIEAAGAAWWRVSNYAQPQTRIPNLAAIVTSLSAAQAAAVLALDVGSLLTVTNWPDQAAASSADFFVEGYNEQIGLEFHRIEFNVSPAAIWTETFVLDSATRGVLDTNRLAY